MDLIHKIESLRYDIENGVETDVINISVRLIQIKDQALQLQQTGVSTCFSDSVIRQAKKLYEKYLSVCAYQLNKVPDENIKNLAKQLAFMEIQEYRFNRWFSNRKYWLEVENALYKLFPIK